jgi:hypothetical protein
LLGGAEHDLSGSARSAVPDKDVTSGMGGKCPTVR